MIQINKHILELSNNYLFAEVAAKVQQYKTLNPTKKIIRLGIGDVTQPLPEAIRLAMHQAVDDLGYKETFHGYGPEQGYPFLIESIILNDYNSRGISLDMDEVFISDGAKSDTGNIGDILDTKNIVGITDPVYPVYIDSNVIQGRAGSFINDKWSDIVYIPCTEENNFIPEIPSKQIDILYLCYPNNPTGTTISKKELKRWVDYALENNVLIMYDAAYEAYIQDDETPHSIYEIEGARQIAIEFRSYSKTAGFTGVRCGYTIIPKDLVVYSKDRKVIHLNKLWNRRQNTKFNGASYISQRGAEAIYSEKGKIQVKEIIQYYTENASIIRNQLTDLGLHVYGGINAPYLWIKTPNRLSSWEFFDRLLHEVNIVGTPGVGFGPSGEGYLRLTAFGERSDIIEAMERIKTWI